MSYLAMVKGFETRHEQYRRALNRSWQGQPEEAEEADQTLIRLLDELGVAVARRIQRDELTRWQEAK